MDAIRRKQLVIFGRTLYVLLAWNCYENKQLHLRCFKNYTEVTQDKQTKAGKIPKIHLKFEEFSRELWIKRG